MNKWKASGIYNLTGENPISKPKIRQGNIIKSSSGGKQFIPQSPDKIRGYVKVKFKDGRSAKVHQDIVGAPKKVSRTDRLTLESIHRKKLKAKQGRYFSQFMAVSVEYHTI